MVSRAEAPGRQGLPSFLDDVEVGQLPLSYRSGGWTIRRISNPFRIDRRQSGGPVDRPGAAQQAGIGAADVVDDVAEAILLRHCRNHGLYLIV